MYYQIIIAAIQLFTQEEVVFVQSCRQTNQQKIWMNNMTSLADLIINKQGKHGNIFQIMMQKNL